MTRGYWNVPSPVQLCYHLIYIAWPFLLGWWRQQWTAPKTKRNNGVQLQGSLWSECPSIFFWTSDSWYSPNGIRCVMAWQSQKIRRAMFFLLINGVLWEYLDKFSFVRSKVLFVNSGQHNCIIILFSMQRKFEKGSTHSTKYISNAV